MISSPDCTDGAPSCRAIIVEAFWEDHGVNRTAGAHVTGRQLNLAFLGLSDCEAALASPVCEGVRLEPNVGLPEAAQLVDLKDRIAAELRAAKVTHVVLVQTRKTNSWAYSDAFIRVFVAAALMFAAHELQVEFWTEKTSVIGKSLGLKPTELNAIEYQLFGFEQKPMYWTTGLAQAYAGAAHALSAVTSDGGDRVE